MSKVVEGLPEYRNIKEIGLVNHSLSRLSVGPFKDKVKGFFLFFKYAYQRIKYGICEYDAFNLYYSLQLTMENGLKMLLNGCCGHPFGTTEQEWREYLEELISKLEFSRSDECEGPYLIFERMQDKYGREDDVTKKALKEWIDYNTKFEQKIHDTMMEVLEDLKPHWEDLWD